MFVPNSEINYLNVSDRSIHTLYTSINQPVVALQEGESKPTFGYIASIYTDDEKMIETFILLYQPELNLAVFYTHESGPVSEDDYVGVENDALDFIESMGFMVDNLNYHELDVEEQAKAKAEFLPFVEERRTMQASLKKKALSQESDASPSEGANLMDAASLVEADRIANEAAEAEAGGDSELFELDAEAIVMEADSDEISSAIESGADLLTNVQGGQDDALDVLDNLEAYEIPDNDSSGNVADAPSGALSQEDSAFNLSDLEKKPETAAFEIDMDEDSDAFLRDIEDAVSEEQNLQDVEAVVESEIGAKPASKPAGPAVDPETLLRLLASF